MTGLEAVKELYNEREYLLGEKVSSKTPSWCEDIKHYDKINECLIEIENELEILEIIKKHYDKNSLFVTMGTALSFWIDKSDPDFEKVKEWLKEWQVKKH